MYRNISEKDAVALIESNPNWCICVWSGILLEVTPTGAKDFVRAYEDIQYRIADTCLFFQRKPGSY